MPMLSAASDPGGSDQPRGRFGVRRAMARRSVRNIAARPPRARCARAPASASSVTAAVLQPARRFFQAPREQREKERQRSPDEHRRAIPSRRRGTMNRATYAVAGMPIRPNIRMRAWNAPRTRDGNISPIYVIATTVIPDRPTPVSSRATNRLGTLHAHALSSDIDRVPQRGGDERSLAADVIRQRARAHRADEHADKRGRGDRRDRGDRQVPLLPQRGRRVGEAVQVAELEEEHVGEQCCGPAMKWGYAKAIEPARRQFRASRRHHTERGHWACSRRAP